MIDLHLHLDGSLTAGEIIDLAKKQGIKLPAYDETGLAGFITAGKASDLNGYLKRFELPLLVLQTYPAIKEAVYSLVKRLDNMGLIYAEIRFAPQLHTKNGLSQYDVVSAAAEGLDKALRECGILVKLILCCMRFDQNEGENMETVALCKEFSDRGVCAVDLAGAEALYKTGRFERIFDEANKQGVLFTIHAGEADGADSIDHAVNFGAKRIGHGVRAHESQSLLEKLRDKAIALEMCPTSNVQTGAVRTIQQHPILKYLDFGILVTVNTDNMTVSGTTIENEFSLLEQKLKMSAGQKAVLLNNSVRASFTTAGEKEILKAGLRI